MLLVVFGAYLALAFRVHGCVLVEAQGLKGKLILELRAAGLRFSREKPIHLGRKKKNPRSVLPSVLRQTARIERLEVDSRVSTGDAMQTALAAGSVRAAILGALAAVQGAQEMRVRVVPDYGACGFELRLRCIFSFCPGDIMLAAAKAAVRKKRKEGASWSAIPLKA